MGGVAGALHLPNLCKLNVPLSSAHWGHRRAGSCVHTPDVQTQPAPGITARLSRNGDQHSARQGVWHVPWVTLFVFPALHK